MTTTPTGDEPLRTVRASIDALGHGAITIDGQDVSRSVAGFEVNAVPGHPVQVAVHVAAGQGVAYDGPALVTVVQEAAEGSPAGVAAWIGRVDPGTLQDAVLARLDLASTPTGLMEATLRQLTEWASGQ